MNRDLIADTFRAIFNRPLAGDLSHCDYYRGVGTCSGDAGCGSRGEPSCITNHPLEGWPAERNLIGRLMYVWKGERP